VDKVNTGTDPIEVYQQAAVIIDIRLQATLTAVQSYPFRIGCVRTLRLEPSDGTRRGTSARAELIMRLLTRSLLDSHVPIWSLGLLSRNTVANTAAESSIRC
jgi:hypothetical protein